MQYLTARDVEQMGQELACALESAADIAGLAGEKFERMDALELLEGRALRVALRLSSRSSRSRVAPSPRAVSPGNVAVTRTCLHPKSLDNCHDAIYTSPMAPTTTHPQEAAMLTEFSTYDQIHTELRSRSSLELARLEEELRRDPQSAKSLRLRSFVLEEMARRFDADLVTIGGSGYLTAATG